MYAYNIPPTLLASSRQTKLELGVGRVAYAYIYLYYIYKYVWRSLEVNSWQFHWIIILSGSESEWMWEAVFYMKKGMLVAEFLASKCLWMCAGHFVTSAVTPYESERLTFEIWDFLLSQINMWTTTTWSNIWVVLPKPSWYEFVIGFFIWTPASKYLHLTTFFSICVILSMFLYL